MSTRWSPRQRLDSADIKGARRQRQRLRLCNSAFTTGGAFRCLRADFVDWFGIFLSFVEQLYLWTAFRFFFKGSGKLKHVNSNGLSGGWRKVKLETASVTHSRSNTDRKETELHSRGHYIFYHTVYLGIEGFALVPWGYARFCKSCALWVAELNAGCPVCRAQISADIFKRNHCVTVRVWVTVIFGDYFSVNTFWTERT